MSAFHRVPEWSLSEAGLKEVDHLQKHLAANIDALEEGLLILDPEFTGLASGKRVDLLAVDRDAKLVVIELKRDDDAHMDLQALRYAAQVSHMTFREAAALLGGRGEPDPDAALLAHFNWEDLDEAAFNPAVRVLLVASDFGSELTTAVLWLTTAHDLDIRCIRLQPHNLEGRTLLNIEQVLPLKEAAAYQTGLKKKQAAEEKDTEKEALLRDWWTAVFAHAAARDAGHPFSGISPRGWSWMASSKELPGAQLDVAVGQHHWHVELRFQDGDAAGNRRLYEALADRRAEVEAAFEGEILWVPQEEGKKVCKVQHRCSDGGYKASPADRPTLQRAQAEAMLRFDAAVRPVLQGVAAEASG